MLKRIDAMSDTTQTIMRGDLSERLVIAGTGDELDRLAGNLNAMLDRIEALMGGLKEVSDNIAHDLKTPLTRLRNRCEEALRTAQDETQYRTALEKTIEESDALIRTFNALLMIARAESGQARDNMSEFDAAEVARGVGELYEPLADDKGLSLKVEAPLTAPLRGNRELVSQALANLVDNAIKYAAPVEVNGNHPEIVDVKRDGGGGSTSPARRVRRRSGDSRGRPWARDRALRAARAKQVAARLRAGFESCRRGRAAARRRTQARRQSPWTAQHAFPPTRGPGCGGGVKTTLLARIATGPHLHHGPNAPARVADWLAEIGDTAPGATLARLLADHPPLKILIAGIADGSPYLWDLIRMEPGRFVALLESDPDARFEAVVAEVARAAASTRDEAEVMRLLRRMKSESALLIALADLSGVWPVMRVTQALTMVADTAVRAALRHLLTGAAERGRLRPPNPARPEDGSGYIVLAMGKMGAHELNYSSDIDLIVFYDAAAPALTPDTEPGPFFVRLTRTLVKLLQERTPDGYVFRTDLRLRPDPGSTGIAVSTVAALDYYESVGQNWERAALIKARPWCARRHRGG